eukprot:GILJ01002300.1.p1 GENE.GILJ01002300.1~~GILJ01002300.1.p1  ORF type:complete len:322 (+),score=18.01 GILJ01002300.1:117-1082(+)
MRHRSLILLLALAAFICVTFFVNYETLTLPPNHSCLQQNLRSRLPDGSSGTVKFSVSSAPDAFTILQTRIQGAKQVIWTLSDKGYIPFLRPWRDRLYSFNRSTIFVASLDNETATYCVEHDIPFVHYPEELGVVKFVLSSKLAAFGVEALFTEMDVFWIEDPFLSVVQPMLKVDPSLDLLITGHVNHLRVNIGVFFARPTSSVIAFFSSLATYYHLRRDLWGPTRDQIIWDGYLRNIDELPDLPTWIPSVHWAKIDNNLVGAGDGVYRYDLLKAIHMHSIAGSKPDELTKLYRGDLEGALKVIPLHSKPLDVHLCGFPKCW